VASRYQHGVWRSAAATSAWHENNNSGIGENIGSSMARAGERDGGALKRKSGSALNNASAAAIM